MLADVEARILENFNSVDIFKMQFKNQALATFGSGWVWLVETTQRQMRIINTFNAGSPNIPGAAHLAYISMPLKELPKTEGSEAVVETTNPYLQIEEMYRPILALSVWEHAYMRDHGVNGREAYIDAFWDAVDWDVVRQRLFPGKPANTSSLGY
jgi:Fe-Mn family superoxide dismutase